MINIFFYKLYIYELKLYIFYIPDKDNFIFFLLKKKNIYIYIQHKIYNLKIKINIYSLNKYIYIYQ